MSITSVMTIRVTPRLKEGYEWIIRLLVATQSDEYHDAVDTWRRLCCFTNIAQNFVTLEYNMNLKSK